MPATPEVEAVLADRYESRVLETVRRAIPLVKRDKFHCTIRRRNEGVLTRIEVAGADHPLLGHILGFLARNIASLTTPLTDRD